MKAKLQYSGSSLRLLFVTSDNQQLSIEIFGIRFIRDILKKNLKPFYKNKQQNRPHYARGTHRKKVEFILTIKKRWLNLSVRIVRRKIMSKYMCMKIQKRWHKFLTGRIGK